MEKNELENYCFGQISWRARPDIAPNTAEFTLLIALRREVFSGSGRDGLPVKGDVILDTIGDTRLIFGDGTFFNLQEYIVIDISEKDNWVLCRAQDSAAERKTVLHNYPAPLDPETDGPWKAVMTSTHRWTSKRHINNPGCGVQLGSQVEFKTLNGSPIAMTPVIINAPQNSSCSFAIAAMAYDKYNPTCRLASEVHVNGINGGFNQPGPPAAPKTLIVDTNLCVVTWDTAGTEPGQLWSYQLVLEDGKSKSCLEAFIRIIEKAGEPPVCAAPDEVQYALIGMPFSIDIIASAPDSSITKIEALNLPLWATFNIITELPCADAVARISGIPDQEDAGLLVMSIIATDQEENQAVSPLKIKVADYGFTDEQPGVF